MAENEPGNDEVKLVDTAELFAELNELAAFRDRTLDQMRRLFGEDLAAMQRTGRLLMTGQGDEQVVQTDLREALDATLDERDHARAAAARFERLGNRYAAAVIRGVA